jgi:class 3 adenylate cyclase
MVDELARLKSHAALAAMGSRLDPDTVTAGDVLGGRFTVIRQLGRGAQGHVFLATDRELATPVVVKLLSADLADDVESRESFRREVVSARAVSHPNVVRVFDYHVLQGLPAMTMEHLPNGTLRERLSLKPPLPMADRLRTLADVADGLHAVHNAGIIHRDIKPANVLFGEEGRARLTDFGIALKTTSKDDQAPRFTPFYAAPEQIRGRDITTASDLYSFGAMAFHILAGQPPFPDTGLQLLDAHLERPAPSLQMLEPDVPKVASDMVARCLEKDAQKRPATALDIARALRTGAAEAEPRRDVSVLFIDLVAFSALATQTQSSTVQVLNRLVAKCPAVADQPAEGLLKLPTGDGLALVFMRGPGPAMAAALQLAAAMTERDLEARLGLHHGSVLTVTDVNDMRNVTGSGMNLAQRVMTLGDPGQVLVTEQFRDALVAARPEMVSAFRGPYEAKVKHGVKMLVWNVVWEGVGKPEVPTRLRVDPRGPARPGLLLAAGGAGALSAAALVWLLLRPAAGVEPVAPVATPVTAAPVAAAPVAAAPVAAAPVAAAPVAAPAPSPPPAGSAGPDHAAPAPTRTRDDPPPRSRPVRGRAPRRGEDRTAAPERVTAVEKPTPAPAPAPAAPAPPPAAPPPAPAGGTLEAAKAAMVDGRYEDAIRNGKAVVEKSPSNAEAHKLLGNAYVLARKPCEARRHFETFMRLYPSSPLNRGIQQRLNQPEFVACR